MNWLEITTGEVQAQREQRRQAESQRAEDPDGQHRRRVLAALRFVVRPALEAASRRLDGARVRLEEGADGEPSSVTLQLSRGKGRRAARLSFSGEPAAGLVKVCFDPGGRPAGRELLADTVSPSWVEVLVERLVEGREAPDGFLPQAGAADHGA